MTPNQSGKGGKFVVAKVACGDVSPYRVNAVVGVGRSCPTSDSDLEFKANGYTACLDYDWDAVNCMVISGPAVVKLPCSSQVTSGRKLVADALVTESTDVQLCLEDGIVHADRRFTVCTKSVP
ncbi:hypothetical protein GCM10009648_35880 [Tsukamurella spumae]